MNSQEIIKQRMVEEGIMERENTALLLKHHPDPVVEIPSLASVKSPCFSYKLVLPEETINTGALSVLQLESIIHACQRHEQRLPNGSRAGFLVGDGAGVGKGRIAAGIIFENFLRGRKKSIWLSVSNEHKYDVERDLSDIGANEIPFNHLHTFSNSLISKSVNSAMTDGVLFSTFSSLTEFSNIHRKYETCLENVLEWCGQDYDGVIVFEELYQSMKQLNNGMTTHAIRELAVLKLQSRLTNARIVYVCATGISNPRNMKYMTRLGLWGMGTGFEEFDHFMKAFEDVGNMELVGMEMKQRGMYLARQLSFQNVYYQTFKVLLDRKFIEVYDNSVHLWIEIQRYFVEAEENRTFDKKAHQTLWLNFWAAHLEFFRYLCISSKILDAAMIAKQALRKRKCVVIGLQKIEEGLSNVVLTAEDVLMELVKKHFPFPSRNGYKPPNSETVGQKRKYSFYEADRTCKKKKTDSAYIKVGDFDDEWKSRKRTQDQLLEKIKRLGSTLPGNWIDHLINELGGPRKVAEISNRKTRAVLNSNGRIRCEWRSEEGAPLEKVNMHERELFMNGKKDIVIIPEVSGISLQNDQRLNNRRPRVYISLECPSNPDLAMQQFGCIHRTGHSKEVSPPEFICLFSDLAGEKHYASNIPPKLESLGGSLDRCDSSDRDDRYVLETVDANAFFYSEHGRNALESAMKSILGYIRPLVPAPSDFFRDVAKALFKIGLISHLHDPPSYNASVSTFIRRSLGIPVELQIGLFQYFTDTLLMTIHQDTITPYFNGMGIIEMGIDQNVHFTKLLKLSTQLPVGSASLKLHEFEIDRGVTWEVATKKWSFSEGSYDGFYSYENGKSTLVSLVQENPSHRTGEIEFSVTRPDTGIEFMPVNLDYVKNLRKIPPDEAKPIWIKNYNCQPKIFCSHVQLSGYCSRKDCKFYYQQGLRLWKCAILSGPLLSAWKEIKSVLKPRASLQVGCLPFEGAWIYGLIIPLDVESRIKSILSDITKI